MRQPATKKRLKIRNKSSFARHAEPLLDRGAMERPYFRPVNLPHVLTLAAALLAAAAASTLGASIRIEGEQPASSTMNRHPWWYDQVKTNLFSGGGFISNFHAEKDGVAEYEFEFPQEGERDLWVHANPMHAELLWSLNGAPEVAVDFSHGLVGQENVAADGKPDLRFIAWARVGKVRLKAGKNRIAFRMAGSNSHHGYLDCFVLADGDFDPMTQGPSSEEGWFSFAPGPDRFDTNSVIDLRHLNERVAGEHGVITTSEGRFIRSGDRQEIRFWGVNGIPDAAGTPEELRRTARTLAKYGVNLVRAHGAVFDGEGEPDPKRVRRLQDVVAALKSEGVYTHFSIYFPLWLTPKPDNKWIAGYDGKKHPFAALLFNPDFQAQYRRWAEALLLTPGPDGKRLIDDPAVMGFEIQNEDSFFFWTFSEQNLPEPQLNLLESQFALWLTQKHGSLEAAFSKWGGQKLKRDNIAAGRVAFRPLWSVANERTERDKDTVAFLYETQTRFYRETVAWLRKLGFKGVINASNWTTADARVLGPLEKMSYTVGDFVDRHGYFSASASGEGAEWSIREGHTYLDRSALKFDGEKPGKGRAYNHPAMDISYNRLPSMISETTWNRPNRYRPEAPLFFAAYGALQETDAIVHFAFDGARWSVKPGYWMQPWTLMSPSQMGQFPATALLYRRGLVRPGEVLAEATLNKSELLAMGGTPLPQDASFDELRLKDVPQGMTPLKSGQIIDPLIHFAGRTAVSFTDAKSRTTVRDLSLLIDRAKRRVTSAGGELELDYEKGVLALRAPAAQGAGGNLAAEAAINLPDLIIRSSMEIGQILIVSLDGEPLSKSRRMLLQVMNEEKPTGWKAEPYGQGLQKITSIGRDPWLVKNIEGSIEFRRKDAAKLRVNALDLNGLPQKTVGAADNIKLLPQVVYYEISDR
jgi:hypothetical protein